MIALVALLAGCGSWSSPPDAPFQVQPRASRPAGAPPNVVLFFADDAGYADFSFQGAGDIRTPAIDRLASQGVRYTDAYVTAPICSPSRAALLTGRYQQRFGHEFNPPVLEDPDVGLPTTERLLPERLRDAGYATGAFGKWHLGLTPAHHPLARGFDQFEGVLKGERSHLPGERHPHGRWLRGNEPVDERFVTVSDAIADATLRFVDAHQDRPFFAYVAFTAVHAPLEAPSADLDAQPDSLSGQRRVLGAVTTAMDRAVGRVLAGIDQLGLADDTVVLFINDNGAGHRNHGDNAPLRGGKGRLFEGGVRVPYVLRWPGRAPAGQTLPTPVSTLDVAPTVLAAAGLDVPPELDGSDLGATLSGDASERALYWRLGDSWAVRDGSLKLLADRGGTPALYDLAADPDESDDLAVARPEDVARLQAAWEAWDAANVAPAFQSATEHRREQRNKRR